MHSAVNGRLPLYGGNGSTTPTPSSTGSSSRASSDSLYYDKQQQQYSLLSASFATRLSAQQRRKLLYLATLGAITLVSLFSVGAPSSGSAVSRFTSNASTKQGFWSSSKSRRITDREPRSRPWVSPTPALPVEATLSERLQDLWEAPLEEPANWVKHNSKTCSRERVKQAQNDWITQDASLVWHSLNSTDVRRYRKGIIDFLQDAERDGLLDEGSFGTGRGLVFTAGNADTYSRVIITMKILRNRYHNTLPAEVFSFPGEAPPADLLPKFEEYNVTLRYISDASRDPTRTKNYQIKSDAIVASSFAEVLYLDSDNVPAAYLGNSDGTFDANLTTAERLIWNAPSYKRLGAMFWPDYWKTGPMNPIWSIVGTQCRDEWEQEAGQIIIDKRRHMDALLLANWMLDDWQFWFRLSDGDKDIFRFAFLALRKRWAVPGRYVGAGALPRNTASGFCGHTMLQYDHLGYPLFVHYNLLKQIPSGIRRGFSWGRTRQTGLFNGGDPLIEGGEGSGDVDADMLANADSSGKAISPAVSGVRYRAALERGIYTRFHGGTTICVDLHWEDARTKEEKEKDMNWHLANVKSATSLSDVDLPSTSTLPEEMQKAAEERKEAAKKKEEEEEKRKGMITHAIGEDDEIIEIDWSVSPLLVSQWTEEPNIAEFEAYFYDEGGKPNGPGFA